MAFRVSCDKCGQAYYYGDAHKCPLKPKALPHVTSRADAALPYKAPAAKSDKSGAKRQKRWRTAHIEKWRAYHRRYMRKWRALPRAA
jgi:hypothetical protein